MQDQNVPDSKKKFWCHFPMHWPVQELYKNESLYLFAIKNSCFILYFPKGVQKELDIKVSVKLDKGDNLNIFCGGHSHSSHLGFTEAAMTTMQCNQDEVQNPNYASLWIVGSPLSDKGLLIFAGITFLCTASGLLIGHLNVKNSTTFDTKTETSNNAATSDSGNSRVDSPSCMFEQDCCDKFLGQRMHVFLLCMIQDIAWCCNASTSIYVRTKCDAHHYIACGFEYSLDSYWYLPGSLVMLIDREKKIPKALFSSLSSDKSKCVSPDSGYLVCRELLKT